MTKEELLKLGLDAYNRGVRDGISMSFNCIKSMEIELIKIAEKQSCNQEQVKTP
jgi:hypothetical protein